MIKIKSTGKINYDIMKNIDPGASINHNINYKEQILKSLLYDFSKEMHKNNYLNFNQTSDINGEIIFETSGYVLKESEYKTIIDILFEMYKVQPNKENVKKIINILKT